MNIAKLLTPSLLKPSSIPETAATGETERIFHEICQSLRVTGVNLLFRKLATNPTFLAEAWKATRPTIESRAFEERADQLRADAVELASRLGRLHATRGLELGESQQYQIQAALKLYHYVNPKLLLITSLWSQMVREFQPRTVGTMGSALSPELVSKLQEKIVRGVPTRMAPMEMIDEKPSERRLKNLFKDIQKTLELSSINSDYRTLALWPEYLEASWKSLKPIVREEKYSGAASELRMASRRLASDLPLGAPFDAERIADAGESLRTIRRQLDDFERLLPGLIINVALFRLDWNKPRELRESPFPPETVTTKEMLQ